MKNISSIALMPNLLRVSVLLFTFLFTAQIQQVLAQASFSCSGVLTETEQRICGSAELSALDRNLSQLYFQVLPNLANTSDQMFRLDQRDFLRARDACGGVESCIFYQYQNRIQDIRALQAKLASSASQQQINTQFEVQTTLNVFSSNSVVGGYNPNLIALKYPASGIGYGGELRAGPGLQYRVVGLVNQFEAIVIYKKSPFITNGYHWFVVQSATGQKGYSWGGIICNFFNRNDAFTCPPVQ